MKEFETVIGLEVHLQFNTATKIFCGCANRFGEKPNTLTCPVCLGLPGTLPVLNRKALQSAVKVALALSAKVNTTIKFDRKNYYYPDLPKGYQISQYDLPIASNGSIIISSNGKQKTIQIKRAHLEEDAGKLIHDGEMNCSLVDYNRTGTPLMEIVSEPDLSSPQEAYDYLTTLKLTLQYLEVSDCDMEKGSLRCDANVSIRKKGETRLGTKTEIKNLNSFKAVKSALEFEIERHKNMISSKERIIQETRLWNDEKTATFPMRNKEEAHDYRYFPEPDLVPFTLSEQDIEEVRRALPELPHQKLERFLKNYGLGEYDAKILVQDRAVAVFFEGCAPLCPETKKICNWIIGSLSQEMNTRKVSLNELSIKPEGLVDLIKKVEDGTVSNLVAKEVLKQMLDTGKNAEAIIHEKGLAQVSSTVELEKIVADIINENAKVVEQIKQGKTSAMGFLVGQAMKKTQGKANPKILGDIIKGRLKDA